MRKLKVAILVVLVLALCSFTLLGKHQSQKKFGVDYGQAYGAEVSIRHDAITAPMPVYPEEAIKDGAQGLVDLAVLFDEEGNFKHMKILDSPHPAISKAVGDALKQWTVKVFYSSPYRETRLPLRMMGELRFHFVISDGVASVENPTLEEQQVESAEYRKILGPSSDRRSN